MIWRGRKRENEMERENEKERPERERINNIKESVNFRPVINFIE